jgi:hypothetical protein
MRNKLYFVWLMIACTVFGQENPPASAPPQTFAGVLQKNFKQWDGNGDGVLSKEEIEAAATNPDTKGEDAAAAATLVHFSRNSKLALPSFTLDFLTQKAGHEPAGEDTSTGQMEDGTAKTPNFQKAFNVYLRKITGTSRELFPQNLPSFDAVHQGNIGDCPFVSTVGALVYRNPAAVKAMFVDKGNGSTIVNFGNGHKLNIHNLTDVDVAMWSSAGTNGLWLTILEKAYRRELAATEHPDPKDRPGVYDQFGSSLLTIDILDGYKTEKISFKQFKAGDQNLTALRERLAKALDQKKIVKTGTTKHVNTAGITRDHAYAVLGFSRDKDEVQVWNPHGQQFTPAGNPGLENGYETKRGMFFVPLKEFVQIFDDVNIETAQKSGRSDS